MSLLEIRDKSYTKVVTFRVYYDKPDFCETFDVKNALK